MWSFFFQPYFTVTTHYFVLSKRIHGRCVVKLTNNMKKMQLKREKNATRDRASCDTITTSVTNYNSTVKRRKPRKWKRKKGTNILVPCYIHLPKYNMIDIHIYEISNTIFHPRIPSIHWKYTALSGKIARIYYTIHTHTKR